MKGLATTTLILCCFAAISARADMVELREIKSQPGHIGSEALKALLNTSAGQPASSTSGAQPYAPPLPALAPMGQTTVAAPAAAAPAAAYGGGGIQPPVQEVVRQEDPQVAEAREKAQKAEIKAAKLEGENGALKRAQVTDNQKVQALIGEIRAKQEAERQAKRDNDQTAKVTLDRIRRGDPRAGAAELEEILTNPLVSAELKASLSNLLVAESATDPQFLQALRATEGGVSPTLSRLLGPAPSPSTTPATPTLNPGI